MMFESVDEFYRRFYFRPRKMFSLLGGMIGDRQVMKRRLREGVEFFQFLRERKREEREAARIQRPPRRPERRPIVPTPSHALPRARLTNIRSHDRVGIVEIRSAR